MPFEKGNTLGGRKQSARQALSESFIRDIQDAWKENGKAAIEAVLISKPEVFLTVVAKLLPRQIHAEVEHIHSVRPIPLEESYGHLYSVVTTGKSAKRIRGKGKSGESPQKLLPN